MVICADVSAWGFKEVINIQECHYPHLAKIANIEAILKPYFNEPYPQHAQIRKSFQGLSTPLKVNLCPFFRFLFWRGNHGRADGSGQTDSQFCPLPFRYCCIMVRVGPLNPNVSIFPFECQPIFLFFVYIPSYFGFYRVFILPHRPTGFNTLLLRSTIGAYSAS